MLQVSGGDNISLEVYARYLTGVGTNTAIINNIAMAVTAAYGITSSTDAQAYTALNNQVPLASSSIGSTADIPKAYLVYILFDNNYVQQQFGYAAITSVAASAHEKLSLQVTVPANGFLYTYVANESNVSNATSVYFDDFSIIHQKSAYGLQVLQTQDYYAFGMGINAQRYQKVSALDNDYLYNGKELQDEYDLNWTDYGARMYMADIGRWGVQDPMAEVMPDISGYSYVYNNPVNLIDPTGMLAEDGDDFNTGVVDEIDFGGGAGDSGDPKKKGEGNSQTTGWSLDWYKFGNSTEVSSNISGQFDFGGEGAGGAYDRMTFAPPSQNLLNNIQNAWNKVVDWFSEDGKDNPAYKRYMQDRKANPEFYEKMELASMMIPVPGASFGKPGKIISNPGIRITNISKHALNQAITRGVTSKTMLEIVRTPLLVFQQPKGNLLFLSRQGVVVLNQEGKVVTTYGAQFFDDTIRAILSFFN